MPDTDFLMRATGAAALAAGVVFLLCGLAWKAPREGRVAVGWIVGAAAGFYVGVWWVDLKLSWPPLEDMGRLLFFLMPATVLVELFAATPWGRWWLAWPLRLVVGGSAARLLLHNSVYLTDPSSIQWTAEQVHWTLIVLPILLAGLWIGLVVLEKKAPGRSVPTTLAMASAAGGVAVMFSDYLTGGQLGLMLAAALAGTTVASLILPLSRDMAPALGVGIVGLFAILFVGHFFGILTAGHALLVFLAPALGWLPELPYVRKLRPSLRGILRIVLVALPLALVVVQARAKFLEDSATSSSGGGSIEDEYRNYGK